MSNTQYTAEFKAEAIKQVIDRGHTVVEVAARLGLPKHTLYDWVQKARKAAAQPAGQATAPSESADYIPQPYIHTWRGQVWHLQHDPPR